MPLGVGIISQSFFILLKGGGQMSKQDKVKALMLRREQLIRQSRKSFYNFCKVMNPSFFKDTRPHLKLVCDTFQGLYEGTIINPSNLKPYRKMMLNLPPGHGKSYTASLFSMWAYGQNKENQIITVSYNEKMSAKFGQTVRDGIDSEPSSPLEIVYSDIFPHIKIKYGDASKHNWSLEGRYNSYLATSFNGTLTGMRGNIGIIDDPVKDAYEAFNENILDDKFEWYTDTFLSRMVEGAIQIVIATRWSTKDLSGRLLTADPDAWLELKLPAYNESTGDMLCDELMSYDRYSDVKKLTSNEIFMANYQQQPMDVQGRLYQNILTYTSIPYDEHGVPLFDRIIAYVDTADTGEDYLCAIVAGVYEGEIYILDVLYTKDSMEITESQTAKLLHSNKVDFCKIESNNGGRGFARNVERLLFENHKNRLISINWFHQRHNKVARILVASSFVQKHVYFPHDWHEKFPKFYEDLLSYQREGKNKHDDAPDGLTGLVEMVDSGNQWEAVPSLYGNIKK